ncbi:MAG: tetratricopeptide repeat protein [Burkholderiaceae bacterium]
MTFFSGRSLCGLVLQGALVTACLGQGAAQAGLFDDEEARKAILDLRQRIEAGRQASDLGLQRLLEKQIEMGEQLRQGAEENAVLRRSLINLQNQIDALHSESSRVIGDGEQIARALAEVQRGQKDQAQRLLDLIQRQQDLVRGQQDHLVRGQQDLDLRLQELQRGIDARVRQFEPSKVTVDGQELTVEPAEKRAYEVAMASFRSSEFVAAQSGFDALIARYPKSGYVPSALFWLGNAQYATREYKEAIRNFNMLLALAPEHLRASEAFLAIANCQIELKDLRGARKSLEELAKAYPRSEAAMAGKDRLARLPR